MKIKVVHEEEPQQVQQTQTMPTTPKPRKKMGC